MKMCRRPVIFFMVLLVAMSAGIATPVQAAPDPEKAKQFILNGIVRTIELLKSQNLPRVEIAKRLRQELRTGFDIPSIAGFALGRLRHTITPDQKRRYIHEFEELVVQTYTNRIFNAGPRVKSISTDIIRVTGTTILKHDQLMVRSEINRSGARWVKIDWRIREQKGRPLIIDIIIVGISQAQVYRSEFTSVLKRSGGGVEGLIAELKKKNAALRSK